MVVWTGKPSECENENDYDGGIFAYCCCDVADDPLSFCDAVVVARKSPPLMMPRRRMG